MLQEIYKIIRTNPIDKDELIKLVPVLKDVSELDFHNPAHIYGILDHSIKAAESLDSLLLRFVMIFHDVGKVKTAVEVPHRTKAGVLITKFPSHEIESAKIVKELFKDEMHPATLLAILKLIQYHDTPLIIDDDESKMHEFVKLYGLEFVTSLLKIQKADMSTHHEKYYEEKIKPKLEYIYKVYELRYNVKVQE